MRPTKYSQVLFDVFDTTMLDFPLLLKPRPKPPPAARHAPPPVHPDSPLARNFRAAIRLVSFVFREISSSAAAPDKRVPYFFMFLWSLLLVVGLPLLAIYLVAQGLHTGQLEPLLFGAIILGDIAGLAYVIRRRSRS